VLRQSGGAGSFVRNTKSARSEPDGTATAPSGSALTSRSIMRQMRGRAFARNHCYLSARGTLVYAEKVRPQFLSLRHSYRSADFPNNDQCGKSSSKLGLFESYGCT
jgi:hypothetical protein